MADETKKIDEELEEEEDLDENQETEEEETTEEEEEAEEKSSKGTKSSGGKSGKKSSGKTFSQSEVKRMMAREKKQGRDALARELGYTSYEAMKKSIPDVKAYVDSKKTPEQKAAEQASMDNEAETRILKAEAKAEAMTLEAKVECVDDIVVMALGKYEEGADFQTIIGEIKTKYPAMFKQEDDGGKETTGKRGTGGSISRDKAGAGNKGKGEKSMGQRLAAQRRSGTKKSSFFDN